MIEDIVKRLRSPTDDDGDLLQDAADEIECLRGENERLREAASALFDLIDEIDTISDLAKDDDKLYRQLVERTQRRRFEIATTDGYSLTFRNLNRTLLEEKK